MHEDVLRLCVVFAEHGVPELFRVGCVGGEVVDAGYGGDEEFLFRLLFLVFGRLCLRGGGFGLWEIVVTDGGTEVGIRSAAGRAEDMETSFTGWTWEWVVVVSGRRGRCKCSVGDELVILCLRTLDVDLMVRWPQARHIDEMTGREFILESYNQIAALPFYEDSQ